MKTYYAKYKKRSIDINIIATSKESTVDKVIDVLLNKYGFDYWWHSVDKDTQNKIKKDLENTL